MNLTEYLFHRLRELGVGHTFGIPGDFVLPVYAVQHELGMPTIVAADEPGVGFAADAYARFRGLGVALVTYGPGASEYAQSSGVRYAEQSPVLVVSGAPEVALRRLELQVHHVVKTYESQLKIYREVTVEAAILDDPASAPETIDRVLRQVINSKRPGYLEIPRNLVRAPVIPPIGPLELEPRGEVSDFVAGALHEAVTEIKEMLANASRPVLYVGVGVHRFGLTSSIIQLAERLRIPVVTDLLGKSTFPESHPQSAGIYMGALGEATVRELVDGSDCVVGIGVALTDLGTGLWTERIAPSARIMIDAHSVSVRYHRFDGPSMGRVVAALIEQLPAGDGPLPCFAKEEVTEPKTAGVALGPARPVSPGVIRVADLIGILRALDQSRYSFVADVGDSWFISLELRADVYVAAGFYSSMGFAIPAALGAGIAEKSRRPFAIVGDGAFQMTGTELGTLVDQNLRAIVLLLNNGGYGMMEAIDGPRPYYERRDWDYPSLARALGAAAERVTSADELRAALERAEACPGTYLIEAITARDDLSPVMNRLRDHMYGKHLRIS